MLINHCHIFPEGFSVPGLAPGKGTISHLKKLMGKIGIEKAVVFATCDELLPTFAPHQNDWLVDILKKEKNFYGFATVNPKERNAPVKLRKYLKKGLKGLKFHPPMFKVAINDPKAKELYRVAEELGAPVLFHTGVHGWILKEYFPILIDEVAQQYPKLPIIIEHVGGTAFFNQALAVLQNNSNCYAGITTTLREDSPWRISDDQLGCLLKIIGADRIIYGTDFPFNDFNGIKEDIRIIDTLPLSSEEKEKIWGKNLLQLLRINQGGN